MEKLIGKTLEQAKRLAQAEGKTIFVARDGLSDHIVGERSEEVILVAVHGDLVVEIL